MAPELETKEESTPLTSIPLEKALEFAQPIIESVVDVPAQINLLARATLATAFVVNIEEGGKGFNAAAFEACWKYISGEEDGEQPENK